MSGKNVLNKEQLERFNNLERELETKTQEIEEVKQKVIDLERTLLHIQETLLYEISGFISHAEVLSFKQKTEDNNENCGLEESTDLLLVEIFETLKNNKTESTKFYEEACAEAAFLKEEKNRLCKIIVDSEREHEHVSGELNDAEEKVEHFRKKLLSSTELNHNLKEDLKSLEEGTVSARTRSKSTGDTNHKDTSNSLDKEITLANRKLQLETLKLPHIQINSKLQTLPKRTVTITKMAEDKTMNMISYITKGVPTFSGVPSATRTEDLRRYLETCKIFYDTLGEDDKMKYMKFIVTLTLIGEAANLMRTTTINTFEELETILNNNYQPERTLSSLNDELRQCSQNAGEKIGDYGRRILEKLAICKAAIDIKYPREKNGFYKEHEDTALKTFKNGLKNEIMKQHAFMQEGELPDLIKKLKAIEDLDDKKLLSQVPKNPEKVQWNANYGQSQRNNQWTNRRSFNNYRNNSSFRQISTPNNNNSRSNGYNNQNGGPVNNTTSNFNRGRQIVCYTCNKPGHTSPECRSGNQRGAKTNNMGRPTPQINEQVRTTREEICDFCLREGHNVADCHPKIQWERKQRERSGNE